jgi:hypothetical protein
MHTAGVSFMHNASSWGNACPKFHVINVIRNSTICPARGVACFPQNAKDLLGRMRLQAKTCIPSRRWLSPAAGLAHLTSCHGVVSRIILGIFPHTRPDRRFRPAKPGIFTPPLGIGRLPRARVGKSQACSVVSQGESCDVTTREVIACKCPSDKLPVTTSFLTVFGKLLPRLCRCEPGL